MVEPVPELPVVETVVPAKGNVSVKWSGVLATAIVFLGAVRLAVAEDGISLQEWVAIGETTLIGAAAAFGLAHSIPAKR